MSRQVGGLLAYVGIRVLLAVPMVLVLLTLVFLLLRVAPGDPALAMLGPRATEETLNQLRDQMGLDDPLYVQYLRYIADVSRGDLGESFRFQQPVWELLRPRLLATVELVLYGFLVAVLLGVAVGVFSANRRGSVWDFTGNLYGIVIYAFPIFWLGIMLQLLISVKWGLLPTSGRFTGFLEPPAVLTGMYTVDALLAGEWEKARIAFAYIALPAGTLGVYISGIFARMTRTNMLQTLKSAYVEAARSRGIREGWVVRRHALKNALVPIVTILGLQFALSLAGAVLTETTFNWPGMANFLVERILERDYPTVQGIVTVFALLVVSVSLVIDVVNAYIDPRIRY